MQARPPQPRLPINQRQPPIHIPHGDHPQACRGAHFPMVLVLEYPVRLLLPPPTPSRPPLCPFARHRIRLWRNQLVLSKPSVHKRVDEGGGQVMPGRVHHLGVGRAAVDQMGFVDILGQLGVGDAQVTGQLQEVAGQLVVGDDLR